MMGPAEILATLSEMGIPFEHYTHPPIASASDRGLLGLDYRACVCKNLLVTTRNQSVFLLLMLPASHIADLKAVSRALGTSRLCFAPDERVMELLGQRPGWVGPLGVVNDREHRVQVVFDQCLAGQPRVATHPSDNTQTVVLAFDDLLGYVRRAGAQVHFIAF